MIQVKKKLAYTGFALGFTLAALLIALWVTPDGVFEVMSGFVPGLDLLGFTDALIYAGIFGCIALALLLEMGGALGVMGESFSLAEARAGVTVLGVVVALTYSHAFGLVYRAFDAGANDEVHRAVMAIEEVAPHSPIGKRLRESLRSPAAWREAREWRRSLINQQPLEYGLEALERIARLGDVSASPQAREIIDRVRRNGVITRADRVALVTAATAPGSGLDPGAVANAMR